MNNRFCPKCGKDIDLDNSINGFCIDCYIKDHEILTIPVFEIKYCKTCDTYSYANRVYRSKNSLIKELIKHIKVKNIQNAKISLDVIINDQEKKYYSEVVVRFLLGNKIQKIIQTQKINYIKEICVACSRVAGNYYTTILQLRFDTKELQKKLYPIFKKQINDFVYDFNKSQKDLKNKVNIVKEKEEIGGVDIYINELTHTKKIIQKLSKNHHLYDTKYSKTLVGIFKNGKKKFRYTLCLHFK